MTSSFVARSATVMPSASVMVRVTGGGARSIGCGSRRRADLIAARTRRARARRTRRRRTIARHLRPLRLRRTDRLRRQRTRSAHRRLRTRRQPGHRARTRGARGRRPGPRAPPAGSDCRSARAAASSAAADGRAADAAAAPAAPGRSSDLRRAAAASAARCGLAPAAERAAARRRRPRRLVPAAARPRPARRPVRAAARRPAAARHLGLPAPEPTTTGFRLGHRPVRRRPARDLGVRPAPAAPRLPIDARSGAGCAHRLRPAARPAWPSSPAAAPASPARPASAARARGRRASCAPPRTAAGVSANEAFVGTLMPRCRASRLDELPRDDLFDRARRALHLDAVVRLQQRDHFLAGGVEQLRDSVNPNCCQIETSARSVTSVFAAGSSAGRRCRVASARRAQRPLGAAASALQRRLRPPPPRPRLRPPSRTPAAAPLSSVAELLLDLAALLFFALDVDLPAGQLRREPDVLPLLADRERQLLVLDDHFHHLLGVVHDRDALHLGRADRVGDEQRPDPPTTRRCRSSRRAARG